MKYDKFFELAKEKGLEASELKEIKRSNLSFTIFREDIKSFSSNSSSAFALRGIYNGKFGAVSLDSYNQKDVSTYVDEIVENAKLIESKDPAIIFKGSEKYKKINTYNKGLGLVSTEDKIKDCKSLEKKIKSLDKRVSDVEVHYNETDSSYSIYNSEGLKLSTKRNNSVVYAVVVAKDENGVTKSGYKAEFGNDYSKLDFDKLAKEAVEATVSRLNAIDAPTKTYKALLSQEVVASLLSPFIYYASSDRVQKNTSLFAGKLGTQVVSKKLTIEERPHDKTVFARGFDDEGVATYNKFIIKNGVLQTYLYNLKTAAKDGVSSTGNGYGGTNIAVDATLISLKKGKLSKDEALEKMGEGIYVTSVEGLHAGLDPISGNFSVQAQGFKVENGKVGKAFDLFTVSGNLLTLFNDVVNVCSDAKLFYDGYSVPSLLIKKINVAGK